MLANPIIPALTDVKRVNPWDPDTFPEELESFREFCLELTLSNGKPFVLEPWQLGLLAPFFGGVLENFILIPKKNGKSTLIAALCLYHLLTTENANCVIVAKTKIQADTLFRQALIFLNNSEALQDSMEAKGEPRLIRSTMGDIGRIKVLASDTDKIDGSLVTLAIIEEYHTHVTSDTYYVLKKGCETMDGQVVAISTAGAREQSPLGRVRQKCRKFSDLRSKDCYSFGYSEDGSLCWHEYALDPDKHDPENVEHVKMANPASWHTAQTLQRDLDSATTEEWQWTRYVCNIWGGAEGAVITYHDWMKYVEVLPIRVGSPIWGGLDIGLRKDTTSLGWLSWEDDGWKRRCGAYTFYTPEDDMTQLDLRAIEVAIAKLAGKLDFDRPRFERDMMKVQDRQKSDVDHWATVIEDIVPREIVSLAYDSHEAGDLIQRVERKYDVVCLEFSQRPDPTRIRGSQRFYSAFLEGKLWHDGDELLAQHVSNGRRVEYGREDWFFGHPANRQERDSYPMDALSAVLQAHDAAVSVDGDTESQKAVKGGSGEVAWF